MTKQKKEQQQKDELLIRRMIAGVAIIAAAGFFLDGAWMLLMGEHCPLYTDQGSGLYLVPVLLLVAMIARPRLGPTLPILAPLGVIGPLWVIGNGLSCGLS